MSDRIVDLTHQVHPGLAHFIHPPLVVIDYHQRRWNRASFEPPATGFDTKLVMMVDHFGTHVDAPSHIHEGAASIEALPLESMIGEAVVIDVSDRPADTVITPAHLQAALKRRGARLERGDIVLIRAWPGPWLADGFYQCRGIDGDATDWLIEQGAKAVGIDLATLDDLLERDPTRPAHVRLLRRNIPIMENIADLNMIRSPRVQFFGVPLRIEGLTGSPIRALAIE